MTEMNHPSKGTVRSREETGIEGDRRSCGVIAIYATFPTMDAARAAARRVVGRHLAACVNILPGMIAIYEWDGAIQEDAEVSVIVKTTHECREPCLASLLDGHPYETPAAVTWEINGGSEAYLDWVRRSTAY